LKRLQIKFVRIMRGYNIMEESKMQQQSTITSLEQTCQKFKEQQVDTHIKFEKEKKKL
jgi:hypothetical protein